MGNAHNIERLSDAFTASQGDHSGDERMLRREDGKYTAYIWIFPGSDRAFIIILLFDFYESHRRWRSWSSHRGGLLSNLGGNLLLSWGINVVILSESLAITGEWRATIIHWKLNMFIEWDGCRASQSAGRAVLAEGKATAPALPWSSPAPHGRVPGSLRGGDGEMLFAAACIASQTSSWRKVFLK